MVRTGARIMHVYKATINSKELKQLSVLEPWRTSAALALDWLVIAAAIAVSEYAGNIWVYLTAVVLIGGRMHALGVLVHEAAHFRFLKDRRTSEWIMDVFAAWPVGTTVDGYRHNHLAHHQHINTEHDPDWVVKLGMTAFTFPQKMRVLTLRLLGYLVAISSLMDIAHLLPRVSKGAPKNTRYRLIRLGFYLACAALFTVLGIWKGVLLYWLIPYFTVFFLFLYVRSVAEHFGGMDYEEELGSTRTVYPYFWERLFFAPHNINYHLEHHMFPGVPYYNLPKLHEALMRDPTYRAKAHLTRGYSTGLVRECLSGTHTPLPSLKVEG